MFIRRSLLCLVILTCFTVSAFAATRPDTGSSDKLVLKLKVNEPLFQTMTTKTDQDMTVMGMNIKQAQEQTFYFRWTPVRKDEKGNWIVKQKIEGIKLNIAIGGNNISYDSTQPNNGAAANPLAAFFTALVGSEFTLTLGPKLDVVNVEGRADLVKKLGAANPQMEGLLKEILGDDALKQMADPAFGCVPPTAKKAGESWTKETKLNMGPIGIYKTTYTYTYRGRDKVKKDLGKIEVKTSLKYEAAANKAIGALPFTIQSADLKTTKSAGTVLFDIAKGRVASSTMELLLEGTMKISIGGMITDVKLTQTQKTTVATNDKLWDWAVKK